MHIPQCLFDGRHEVGVDYVLIGIVVLAPAYRLISYMAHEYMPLWIRLQILTVIPAFSREIAEDQQ